MLKSNPLFPAPEAIDPRVWKIVDAPYNAHIDFKNNEIWVPMDPDLGSRSIRAHEMAHAAFTPRDGLKKLPYGVEMQTLQSIEDYRVNKLARQARVAFEPLPEKYLKLISARAAVNPKDAALLMLSAFPEDDVARDVILKSVDERYDQRAYSLSENAKKWMHRTKRGSTPMSFKRALAVARWFDRAWRSDELRAAGCFRIDTDGLDLVSICHPGAPESAGDLLEPGDMTIECPPRRRLKSPRAKQATGRSCEEGSLFNQPWRVTTDHKVFSHRRAKARATVLIDCSGSMSLSELDIETILQQVPAAIVAGYAGDQDYGVLRIFAARGGVVESRALNIGLEGNVVDLPALEWLEKQPAPRWWICDGGVTGIDDQQSLSYSRRCEDVAKRARVRRFGNPEELVAFLKESS